jgi:predicted nucleic acid-binding protein
LKVLVFDASITVSWRFEDEASAESEALLDLLKTTAMAVVPSIWRVEVANALLMAKRRKRAVAEATFAFLDVLVKLNVIADSENDENSWRLVVALAREQGITAYDASYLELAIRMNVPIATKDARLISVLATFVRNPMRLRYADGLVPLR